MFTHHLDTLQTPKGQPPNFKQADPFLLVEDRFRFFLLPRTGDNKINSYSDQLKLSLVSKFVLELVNSKNCKIFFTLVLNVTLWLKMFPTSDKEYLKEFVLSCHHFVLHSLLLSSNSLYFTFLLASACTYSFQ